LALSTLSPWHEHLDDNQTSSIRSWSKLGTTEDRISTLKANALGWKYIITDENTKIISRFTPPARPCIEYRRLKFSIGVFMHQS
jgi:hypothetical protein